MAKLRDLELGESRTMPFAVTHTRADGSKVELKARIKCLNGIELDRAMAQAVEYVRELRKGFRPPASQATSFDESTDRERIEDARMYEALAIALRDADDVKQPWSDATDLRTRLSVDQVGAFWKAYEAFQAEQSPIVQEMTKPQYEAVVKALQEDAENDPLLLCAYSLRKSFTRTLAVQLGLSEMANSSLSARCAALETEIATLRGQTPQPEASADSPPL